MPLVVSPTDNKEDKNASPASSSSTSSRIFTLQHFVPLLIGLFIGLVVGYFLFRPRGGNGMLSAFSSSASLPSMGQGAFSPLGVFSPPGTSAQPMQTAMIPGATGAPQNMSGPFIPSGNSSLVGAPVVGGAPPQGIPPQGMPFGNGLIPNSNNIY